MKTADKSGKVAICLWRDMANQNINKGDQIRLKNFTVTDCLNRYNNPTPACIN